MSIPDYARANFNTLLRAAASGDLALVECAVPRRASHATSYAPSDVTAATM
jgi:hypothetical protein